MSNLALVSAGLVAFAILALIIWVAVKPLMGLSRAIDAMNVAVGRVIAWAIFAAVVVSTVNAIVRKAFDLSSNAWLELQWVLFGAVFLLCASWTMIAQEHIRIDIVSSLLPRRVRSWIDYVGHLLFLIPTAVVMTYTSWPFFFNAFKRGEQSANAGGLVVWPSKMLVLLGFVLLLLQGISELIKRTAILRGYMEENIGGGHHDAAAAEAERLRQTLADEAAAREAAAVAAAGKKS